MTDYVQKDRRIAEQIRARQEALAAQFRPYGFDAGLTPRELAEANNNRKVTVIGDDPMAEAEAEDEDEEDEDIQRSKVPGGIY